MNNPKSRPSVFTGKMFLVAIVLAAVFPLAVAVWVGTSRFRVKPAQTAMTTGPRSPSETEVFAAYGKSPTCKSCHEEAYANWEKSHHALAERKIDPALDQAAFDPARIISHGTQTSEARLTNGVFQIITTGLAGQRQPFVPERVIGVDPLLQYLIPAPGGRWQTAELCFDPHRLDWFNVFGSEDRKPGEWGHWTGRGMNWNNMCAVCHNTRVRRNYDERTDTYRTAMAEMGVGCEACHGPMADHNAWQAKNPNKSGDPTVRKITRQEMFSVCGQCHARRAELTGDFKPGDNFFDHHQLTIPDETDVFYPDGQIWDEDYEFVAFLGSKMHGSGVRCVDCHEPHSMKLRLPGNLMCMSCHANTLTNGAPRIDPETHSFHKPKPSAADLQSEDLARAPNPAAALLSADRGSAPNAAADYKSAALLGSGDDCVHCHMPLTTYMQRHPRHDHGFTIPDPRLTKEFNIPNACNRCHTNQTADWSLEAMNKWYGPRTNELVRHRASAVARARDGAAAAVPQLVKLATDDTNFLWRAIAANLLKRWPGETGVLTALRRAANDTNELVRGMALRGLEPLVAAGDAATRTVAQTALNDPVRSVRIEAAWALRQSLDTNSLAGRDLLAFLHLNADQPSGAMQLGVFHLDRGDRPLALDYFQRAVSWDTNSAPLHHALALALSMAGRANEAFASLQTACRLAPRDAEYRYKLALALNEVGRLNDARVALEETVKLDPQFAAAWYNLGLAHAAQRRPEAALEALLRAESLDPRSARIPYARATVLVQLGRTDEARRAAQRALELDPSLVEARGLLQQLEP